MGLCMLDTRLKNKKMTQVLVLLPYPASLSLLHITRLYISNTVTTCKKTQKEEEMISLRCSVCPRPSWRLEHHDRVIILFLVAVGEKEVKESTHSPTIIPRHENPIWEIHLKNGDISFLRILWALIERTIKWGLQLEYLVWKLNPVMAPLLENRGAKVICPLRLPCYLLLCVMGYHMGELNFIFNQAQR